MCLESISHNLGKEVAKLKTDSRGYITLWKVFGLWRNELRGDYQRWTFYEGKNTAKECRLYSFGGMLRRYYDGGFHCFATEKGAERWGWYNNRYIQKVKTRKKWIVAMGTQQCNKVVVCKHIII